MKKKDIITIIVLLVIFGIIFLIAFINRDKEEEEGKTEYNKLTLLTNEDIFLSVSNNINKTFEYSDYEIKFVISDKNNENKYKGKSFVAEKIYVVSKSSLYKYYVKGNLYKVSENYSKLEQEIYFIMNYDINTKSYNIEEIDKLRYENATQEEYEFKKISSNEYNKFEYTTLSNKNRASMYFNDFIKKMYLNTEEAYNLLSNDTKERYFNTLDDFKTFVKKYTNITLKEYGIKNNQIGVLDNNGIEYTFDISYVLKYNVSIKMTEE